MGTETPESTPESVFDGANAQPPEASVAAPVAVSAPASPASADADDTAWDRFECRSCGYIYEPLKGDIRARIPANTAFSEIPLDWRCPVCGVPKKGFSNIGVKGAPSGFKENLGYGFGVNVMTPGQKNLLIFGALGLAFLFFLSLYGLQ